MLAPYYEYRCFRWNKRRRRTEACLKAGASKSVSDRCRIIKGGILIAGTINNLCVETQLKTWRDKEFVWLFCCLKRSCVIANDVWGRPPTFYTLGTYTVGVRVVAQILKCPGLLIS